MGDISLQVLKNLVVSVFILSISRVERLINISFVYFMC